MDFKHSKNPPKLCGMENHPITIKGEGFLQIKIDNSNKTIKTKVYFCPYESATVLSIATLQEDTGYELERGYKFLTNNILRIKVSKVDKTLWINSNNLLVKNEIKNKTTSNKTVRVVTNKTKKKVSIQEAHAKFNHIDKNVVKATIESGIFADVDGLKETSTEIAQYQCEDCLRGKLKTHNHYTGSMNAHYVNVLPGASWSIDLRGPIVRSHKNVPHYLLVMVDNVSRYMMISTHLDKSSQSIPRQIIKNIHLIENQFDRKVKELITDRGTEFNNSVLKEFIDGRGIKWILTDTDDHASNGRVERYIGVLNADLRTLMIQSQLPWKLWKYAAMAATDSRNTSLNKMTGQTPFNMISGNSEPLLYKSLIPFGQKAFVKDHKKIKTGLQGLEALALCKDPESRGYYFYLPETRKIVTTSSFSLLKAQTNHQHNEHDIAVHDDDIDMESLSDERDYNITIDSDVNNTDLSTDLSGTDETEEDEHSSQEVEFTHENNESGQQEVELEKILDEVYEVPSQLRENRVDKIKEVHLDETTITDRTKSKLSATPHIKPLSEKFYESEEEEEDSTVESVSSQEIPEDEIQSESVSSEEISEAEPSYELITPQEISEDEPQDEVITPQDTSEDEVTNESVPSREIPEDEPQQEEVSTFQVTGNEHQLMTGQVPETDKQESNNGQILFQPPVDNTESTDEEHSSHLQQRINNLLNKKFYSIQKPSTKRKSALYKQALRAHDFDEMKKNRPLQYEVPVVHTIRSMYYNEAITNNTNMKTRKLFQEAYQKELDNLKRMLVFDIQMGIPRNQVPKEQIIPVQTIFNVKRDGTHKARIVCRGDKQTASTYGVITTDLLQMDTLKLLLMIANNNRMVVQTLDINHAFLYADLQEVIYIPHPYEPRKVVQLNKALYGLKQSPKEWNDHLRKYLNNCSLYDTEYTPGLFMNNEKSIIIAVYVDDCIIAAKNNIILKKFINKMKETFELKIVGTMEKGILKTDILGMDLDYDITKGEISLSLETYLKSIENDWIDEINYIKFDNSPHWSSYDKKTKGIPILSEIRKKEITKNLQIMAGIINYILTRCRYDIAFAANKLARSVNTPNEQSIKIAHKILKYLFTTKDRKLIYRRETGSKPKINIVTDASLGTEWDYKSRIGIMVWYGRNLYKVISRATTSIRVSSTEAELDAIYEGFKEGKLLKKVLEKLKILNNIDINIFTDSKPSIQFLNKDYRSKKRDKFIDLKLAKLSEQVRENIIAIEKIPGVTNVADILTKPVTTIQFKKIIECLENKLNPEDILHITELEESKF
ncbi:Tkp4 protein, partial [Vanderwaltozyma polyspora DSM 70294]